MFDLGIQELVVIFIVALLVFGPKRLPELAKNMGKGVAELKKAMFDIRHEIDQEVGGVTKLDLENLPTSSDDLKKALEEKAMEAVGFNDEPIPENPDDVLKGVNEGGDKADGPPEEDTAAAEPDVKEPDVKEPDVKEPDVKEAPLTDAGDAGVGEDTSAAEPEDPYGGLSAEERVAPEEDDEQDNSGQSRESNA